jgi:hypothetical protein
MWCRAMKKYTVELDGIMRRFDDDLTALGKKVREQVVVPACKKYKLEFTSGMGVFFFKRRAAKPGDFMEPHYGNRRDLEAPPPCGYRGLSKSAKGALGPILDLLNEEFSRGQYLGYFVEDVRAKAEVANMQTAAADIG